MSPRLASNLSVSNSVSSVPLGSLFAGEKHKHVVRFYSEDTALIDTLAPVAEEALAAGDAVLRCV